MSKKNEQKNLSEEEIEVLAAVASKEDGDKLTKEKYVRTYTSRSAA